MADLRVETPSLSDYTEFTEAERSATHHGSTIGTDPLGMAAQREGLKAVFGGTDAQGEAKSRLQESLDAMWPGGTPAHGGELFGPPSTTPPGNGHYRQQNPGAPFENRNI